MIKKILLAIMIALPMCAMAQTKIGVINADSIFQIMPESTQAMTQLQEKSKVYEDEMKKLEAELQKKSLEFDSLSNDPNTSDAIKNLRLQEAQDLYAKAQQFKQTAEQDVQKLQQQLFAPIRAKLMEAINTVGKENGFTAILPIGVAIYTGSDVIDVTPLVKAKLGIK